MKKIPALFFLLFSPAIAQEKASDVRIESVGLFKNGLAVVRMTGSLPADGSLELADLPRPVHGTFSVVSEKPVTARVEFRSKDAPLDTVSQAELLRKLAGKPVTLHLSADTIAGKILGSPTPPKKQWNRDLLPQDDRYSSAFWYSSANRGATPEVAAMIFIQTASGKVIAMPQNQILRVECDQLPEIRRDEPVLVLSSAAAGHFEIEYLAKGLSWAPGYRIDLSDPEKLGIAQSAAVRNELADLRDAEIRLISGFPSVRFGSVDSPISPQTTWKSFFDQLASRPSGYASPFDNGITQQVAFNRSSVPDGGALGPVDEGESVDLHYQPIGRHTLAAGEAFSTEVARAEAPYERVVEWNIADTRSPNGNPVPEHERTRDPEKFDQTPWDAIVFRNPFDFPMTTGPATLVKGSDFLGQQLATWTNPGSETTIRITKALSLSTRTTENEVADSRVNLRLGDVNHYRVRVRGELMVKNHRNLPAAVIVRRQFSGDLKEADGEPETTLLESGVYSINKRNQMKWRVELKPGEERTIGYEYEVLVRN